MGGLSDTTNAKQKQTRETKVRECPKKEQAPDAIFIDCVGKRNQPDGTTRQESGYQEKEGGGL